MSQNESIYSNSLLRLRGNSWVFEWCISALHCVYIIYKTFEPKLVSSPGGTVGQGNTYGHIYTLPCVVFPRVSVCAPYPISVRAEPEH